VGVGKEGDLGSILVADFVFDYFMGAIFEGLVVGVFAFDVRGAVESALPLVDWMGL
jgi:hypothetical protein